MKTRAKKIIFTTAIVIAILALAGFVGYKGFYVRVHNQSNTEQNTEIGGDIERLTIETIVKDMYEFPNRFAGTKDNARAGQYIRNYYREAGLEPYFPDGYYQSFYSRDLKCSRYFMLQVDGTVENIIGRLRGQDRDKAVVISAHMDSYLGKGVLDNASGTAVLLEVAKRLSQRMPQEGYPVDIIFAAYNAEECGMIGSMAFYEELSKDYTDFYNINMDCVGAAGKPLAMNNTYGNSEKLYRDFYPFLDKHGIPHKDIAYAADEDGVPVGSSDHEVFQEKGHAAIILGEADILGIPNTIRDRDLSILDFPELNRLADAVEDFIVTAGAAVY